MKMEVILMADKTIMLVCAAGVSTTLLVEKMQKAAENRNLDIEIIANSAEEADQILKDKEIDIMLLGPQVRFMRSKFEKKVQGKNIPVDVINMQDYGMVNGENVLLMALDSLETS